MAPAPNILLVTADQWRGDTLGAAGHPLVKTPNIDRLAGEGTIFLRQYAQTAPCSPARASLYTGLYQMNHRVLRNGTPLDARHDNVALAMRRAGYRPTLFGYTDQSPDPRGLPPDSPLLKTYEGILPGFDVGLQLPERPEAWLAWLSARGVPTPDDFWEIFRPVNGRYPSNAPARFGADETLTAFLTGVFLDWLGERPKGEPWFAHLSYLSPHPPYVAPAPFNDMYDPASGPAFRRAANAEAEKRQHPFLRYTLDTGDTGEWDDEVFRTVRAIYWGMVSEVDRQVGRLLAGLAAAGAADTIVVLTSDHGEMLGDHWARGKFGYFDQAFHVPLIVRDPRRPGGHRVGAFTESVDVMPTVLELAGARPPGHLDGCSLVPFLEGSAPAGWRDAAHWEYDFREVATGAAQKALGLDLDSCSLAVERGERFKYVHFAGLPPLLFDLEADPGEMVDVAGDPAYAAVRLECAEKLLAWRARHLDRTLTGIELTALGPVDARA